ncbi:hypothetical protein [Streptomyces xanthophaeus]|uniref:hypothetical protein n=1 Tax=Streptomyces xanthophaeus TaxID=67385 RepID=UPI002647B617|nr:hypothetical protein [Streptomyces xanthophaeus]WKD30761.1 hypothetical protein KO717_01440 [Streptomyces xanthophaeus]
MLAEEYGYAISPRPAAQVPGVARKAQNALEPGYASRIAQGLAGGIVVTVALTVIFHMPFAVAGASGVIGFIGVWPTELAARRKHALKTLEHEPWQVWPCRLDGEAGPDNQALVGARVQLLAPDRTPVAAFRGAMSCEDWLSVRDGRGVDQRVLGLAVLRIGRWPNANAKPRAAVRTSARY